MSVVIAAETPDGLRLEAPQSSDLATSSAPQQMDIGRQQFIVKADLRLAKHIPEWAESRLDSRHGFINLCIDRSARYGLLSVRSVMAYTHSSIWLGRQFEETSI